MYTRAETGWIFGGDEPPETIERAAEFPPGDAYNFVMAGFAHAYCDNLLIDKGRAFEIECVAEELQHQRETDKMPSIDDVFVGHYVKAPDLKGDTRVGITGVQPKQFDEGPKLILSFHNTDKQMVCNVTNARMIATMHGNDYNGWIGKTIVLGIDMVQNPSGQIVPGLRVRYEQPTAPQFGNAPASAPAAAPLANGLGQPAQMPTQQPPPAPAERPIGGLGAQAPDPFEPAPAQGAPVSPAADLDDEIPF